MTHEEQIEFVRKLTENILSEALRKHRQWPEDWDGNELRELMYRKFLGARSHWFDDNRLARVRAFNNVWITKNL